MQEASLFQLLSFWKSENKKYLSLRCFYSICAKLYLTVVLKNCLCGMSLLKMHVFSRLFKHASLSFSASWHKSSRREEKPQDKLPNMKELKCLLALRKDLPSIYHTASFATGSLLALSLNQLRGQWESSRYITALV